MNLDTTFPLRTGRGMPVWGLGTWQLTENTAGVVAEALRLGYRMVDTSSDYDTQPGIGEGIRQSAVERRRIYITTKVEEDKDAYEGAVRNLRELGVDFVDLTLIHRPPPGGAGGELWAGLIRARNDGLTRDIGVSNYTIEQIDELADTTGETPVVNQIEWTPFGWSAEMLHACRARKIALQAYSPLTRAARLDDHRLVEIAAQYGMTTAQLLLRWNLQHGVAPLPKANRLDHLRENLEAFTFELREADMTSLDELNEEWSALGPSPQYL